MDRRQSFTADGIQRFLCASLCLCALAFISAGCGDSQSGQYKVYSQLEGGRETPQESSFALSADQEPDSSELPVERDSLGTADIGTPVQAASDETVVRSPGASTTPADPNLSRPRRPGDVPAFTSGESLPIKLLVPNKRFRTENGATRATFDDIDLLKVLNMQPVPVDAVDYFPDWLKQLDGTRVRIRGFMRPSFEEEDLTRFLFVRDNGECCYGPKVAIYDVIAVTLSDGETTDFIQNIPFDVEGTFRIEPLADEAELLALFFIEDGVIIE